jgi:general secretion pathway protein I
MSHSRAGFTLLEAMLAMSILAVTLVSLANVNSTAIASHAFTKKLTVATLLARSKMTDIEQELYQDGFQVDDDEKSGDFSKEGFPSFKWKAKILAPKTTGISPDKLLSALFNVPVGGGEGGAGLASLFTGGGGSGSKGSGSDPMGMMGPAAGMISGQMDQMIQSISQQVREVRLVVTWKDRNQTETLDVVTHIVSGGPGGDRNGAMTPNDKAAAAQQIIQGNNRVPGAPNLPNIPGIPNLPQVTQ